MENGANKKERMASLRFDQEELWNAIKERCSEELEVSLRISHDLNMDFNEENFLNLAAKAVYVDRLLKNAGQVPLKDSYDIMTKECSSSSCSTPFNSPDEMEQFILSMRPFFLHFGNIQHPRATSYSFKVFIQYLANLLKNGGKVNNENIDEIIGKFIGNRENLTRTEMFRKDELYTDLKSLRFLSAHVPWFNYYDENGLELSENANLGAALWFPILIPKLDLDEKIRDNSRTMSVNAVIIKSLPLYHKAKIIAAGPLSGYYVYISPEMRDDKGNSPFDVSQIPSKTFVTIYGQVTPNDACQLTGRRIGKSMVRWNMDPFGRSEIWEESAKIDAILKSKTKKSDEKPCKIENFAIKFNKDATDYSQLVDILADEMLMKNRIKRLDDIIASEGIETVEQILKKHERILKSLKESHEEFEEKWRIGRWIPAGSCENSEHEKEGRIDETIERGFIECYRPPIRPIRYLSRPERIMELFSSAEEIDGFLKRNSDLYQVESHEVFCISDVSEDEAENSNPEIDFVEKISMIPHEKRQAIYFLQRIIEKCPCGITFEDICKAIQTPKYSNRVLREMLGNPDLLKKKLSSIPGILVQYSVRRRLCLYTYRGPSMYAVFNG